MLQGSARHWLYRYADETGLGDHDGSVPWIDCDLEAYSVNGTKCIASISDEVYEAAIAVLERSCGV